MKQIPQNPKIKKKIVKNHPKKQLIKKKQKQNKNNWKTQTQQSTQRKKTMKHRYPTEEDSTADSTVSNSPEESKIEKPFRETTGSKDDPSRLKSAWISWIFFPGCSANFPIVVPSKQQHFGTSKFTLLFLLLIICHVFVYFVFFFPSLLLGLCFPVIIFLFFLPTCCSFSVVHFRNQHFSGQITNLGSSHVTHVTL